MNRWLQGHLAKENLDVCPSEVQLDRPAWDLALFCYILPFLAMFCHEGIQRFVSFCQMFQGFDHVTSCHVVTVPCPGMLGAAPLGASAEVKASA